MPVLRFLFFALCMTSLAVPCAAMTLEEFTGKVIALSAQAPDGPDQALELCDKALAEFAGDDQEYVAAALAFKSQAYRLKGDFERSEAEARAALRFYPESALGHFMLTDALNEQRRFDEAREVCLQGAALMDNPEYQEYMSSLCKEAYAFNTAPPDETAPDGTSPDAPNAPDAGSPPDHEAEQDAS